MNSVPALLHTDSKKIDEMVTQLCHSFKICYGYSFWHFPGFPARFDRCQGIEIFWYSSVFLVRYFLILEVIFGNAGSHMFDITIP